MRAKEVIFIREVSNLYKRLGTIDPYELLRIHRGTDSENLKKNYYQLVRKFHPDRYSLTGNEELKNKLTAIFNAITNAYHMLKEDISDKTSHMPSYFASKADLVDEQQKQVIALEQFTRGIREYKDGNYWQAAELFRWATRLDPKKAKHWSYLSLSLLKIPKRLKQAEEALLEAIKLEPFSAQHYANLGFIYLSAGLKRRAKKQFEKALKFDSRNDKALKGIKELDHID